MEDIIIFDTTLRDGEQSPGASMNTQEKLEVARALDLLGVDVIEAGFPVSSPDDWKAVNEVARLLERPTICTYVRVAVELTRNAGVKGSFRQRL